MAPMTLHLALFQKSWKERNLPTIIWNPSYPSSERRKKAEKKIRCEQVLSKWNRGEDFVEYEYWGTYHSRSGTTLLRDRLARVTGPVLNYHEREMVVKEQSWCQHPNM